jgi:hypothetical protein
MLWVKGSPPLGKGIATSPGDPGYDSAVTDGGAETAAGQGTGLVLVTLASGQFLMTLDSSVMNVAIATVAKDVGTTVTGSRRRSPSTRW